MAARAAFPCVGLLRVAADCDICPARAAARRATDEIRKIIKSAASGAKPQPRA
jgi:hypothetical protein